MNMILPCGWPLSGGAHRSGVRPVGRSGGSSLAFVSPRHVSQRYRCRDCKGHFSVRKGTTIQKTKISLRAWVLAIHLVSMDTESENIQADPS